ncbi:amidase [Leucobacter viscericola]|uniref:Amidase n=1 Tax=Leucobacter viscericola TaxID=2714935 RepID=A0A6G7XGI6_9MICO|nr:amidase [Leucobacter viscericola]QIK63488.1 amidase [Leucobacter viscericola]
MSSLPDTALELRATLRSGELSTREVTEQYLGRITERADLGAFVSVTAEQATHEATVADNRFAEYQRAGRSNETLTLPPLHGLPLAHKDLVDVAGATTTHGSAAVPHELAKTDSPGAGTLRRAGALSLGKTQVPEFGLTGYSENLIVDPARNPLDPSRTAGGSSGGSAAAVAAGLLPFAPGSDGGGSIRIPALACGIVGLKPGLGTIPSDLRNGARDPFGAPRLTVSGPLARNTADAAMLFDAMRGAQGEPSLAAVRTADRVSRLRIGVSTASPFESAYPITLSPDATAAVVAAAQLLEQRNHRVEEARIAYDPGYPEAFMTAWTAGLSQLMLDAEAEDRLTPLTREFRERALARSESEHHAAGSRLRGFASDVREQWGRYDVVLTPGLAFDAPRVGAFTALSPDDDYRLQCEWAPFTSMVNVSGLPAIAVPILSLPSSLSMGVQLIGRAGSEVQLLQLATQLMGTETSFR